MSETNKEIAAQLAGFLTQPPRYGGKSPLNEMLDAQISQLTRHIAQEVIAATPELHDHVRRMVERTVQEALARDGWLNTTVVSAVSKAITDLALERQRDADDG